MSKQPQQADGEIHEDQLLNFLVNSLDEEVALTLAENPELDAEDIYEVLLQVSETTFERPFEHLRLWKAASLRDFSDPVGNFGGHTHAVWLALDTSGHAV